jgi:uncharacterized membrane protein
MKLIFLLLVLWFLVTFLYFLFWIIGNISRNFQEFFDKSIPHLALFILFLGIIFSICGAIILWIPKQNTINTAGISIAALGLATIAYSMTQLKNFESKKDTEEIKTQLTRILKNP